MSLSYEQINQNRQQAVYNKDFGVGKINAIIRNKGLDKSQKVSEIAQVVETAIDTNSPSVTDIFYAGVEAIKGIGGDKGVIVSLFNKLNEKTDSLSPDAKGKVETEITNSEKMTGILFESLVETGDMQGAIKLLPKLQNNVNSNSFVSFHEFTVMEVEAFDFVCEVSGFDKEETKKTLVDQIKSTTNFLQEKFDKTLDFKTGTELMRMKLISGQSMSEIKTLADKVYLSSKKFNIEEMKGDKNLVDYVFVLKMCSFPEAKEKLAQLNCSEEQLDLINTDDDMVKRSKSYKDLSKEEREQVDESLKMPEQVEQEPLSQEQELSKKKAEAVINGSYSYAGTLGNIEEATYVGGNLGYSGQVPDHCITKNDVKVFDALLDVEIYKLFPLKDVKGPKDDPSNRKVPEQIAGYANKKLKELDFEKEMPVFMSAVDGMIRERFTTMDFAGTGLNMEHQALLKESAYNDAFKSILAESGAFGLNVDGNSLTNISSLFMEGVGDCRHHAQVKQIMFDRWKDAKMNEAINSLETAKPEEKEGILASIDEMSRTELRTFDVSIETNVQMEQGVGVSSRDGRTTMWSGSNMYRPERDENGQFTIGESTSALEEHTMCMLVTRDKKGGLSSLRFADAFYQAPEAGSDYDLGYSGSNNGTANGDLSQAVVPDEKGRYSIDARGIFNRDNVQGLEEGQDVSVRIVPTAYAGKRDSELYGRFEHNQLCGQDYGREIDADSMLETIGETSVNHQERVQSAKDYSFLRKCIIKNMLAMNINEERTFDIDPQIRAQVEQDAKNKSVVEIEQDKEANSRLSSVCNDFSEMKSEVYNDIYYSTIEKLQGQENLTPSDIERICDQVAQDVFKKRGLENATENRKKAIQTKKATMASAIQTLRDDKKTSKEEVERFYNQAINYLKLNFPPDIIAKFEENVRDKEGNLDLDLLIKNMEEAAKNYEESKSQSAEKEEPESQVEEVKEVEGITIEQILEDPMKFVDLPVEEFAGDPVAYLTALKEAIDGYEKAGKITPSTYSTLNKAIEQKQKEINKTVSMEENARKQATAQKTAENANINGQLGG